MLEQVNGWLSADTLLSRVLEAESVYLNSGGRDRDCLAAAFHPAVVMHEPASLPCAGDWQGLDGVAARLRRCAGLWSDSRLEDRNCLRRAETVMVSATLRLTVRATGRVIVQPYCCVLHFQDDLLLDGTPFYYDTAEILAALH